MKVHLLGIVIFHKFEIFHNHGGIYWFETKFNKNFAERWSPNNFMQSLSVFYSFLMTKTNIAFKFLFTFMPWLLNFSYLRSYGSELRKRYTLRLFLMCLEERSFGNCSAWGNGRQMTHFGQRCVWGKTRGLRKPFKLTIKWASSKKISEESTDTSSALLTGCFLDTIYWITLQKMHISEYVSKIVLKN